MADRDIESETHRPKTQEIRTSNQRWPHRKLYNLPCIESYQRSHQVSRKENVELGGHGVQPLEQAGEAHCNLGAKD